MIDTFDVNNCDKYIHRWCLYKHRYFETAYTKIYIGGISDGIIKYKTDTSSRWIYEDVSKFDNVSILISPFNDDDQINEPTVPSYQGICMDIDSDKPCTHDWVETVLASYPPIHQRTCRRCGKVQHREPSFGEYDVFENDWVDGQY